MGWQEDLNPFARFCKKQANSIHRRLSGRRTYVDAQSYTCTTEFSGQKQVEILSKAGLAPSSHVLEIGCGCLSAGSHLITFLDADRYVGIEPNEWLIETALLRKGWSQIVAAKRPLFLHNVDFDASSANRRFDFVLSHSILSHASWRQLPLFLENVAKVLAPDGRIFASLYLAEGSDYHAGTPDKKDSRDEEWVYPGVSYFEKATVERAAAEAGLSATYRYDLTHEYVKARPGEIHDWFEFACVMRT